MVGACHSIAVWVEVVVTIDVVCAIQSVLAPPPFSLGDGLAPAVKHVHWDGFGVIHPERRVCSPLS